MPAVLEPTQYAKSLKDQMRKSSLAFADCRMKVVGGGDNDPGHLEGYAAKFGNVDYARERLVRGCFARTLDRVIAGKVKLLTKHLRDGGDVPDLIGKLISGSEESYGLLINAPFARIPRAQEARQLVLDDMVDGLSIGYQIVNAKSTMGEDDEPVYDILEVKLWEVTLTCFPMNELALVTDAKTFLEPCKETSPESTSPIIPLGKAHDWESVFTDCERALALNERYFHRVKSRSLYDEAQRIAGRSPSELGRSERFAIAG